jgi:hypothetical protein
VRAERQAAHDLFRVQVDLGCDHGQLHAFARERFDDRADAFVDHVFLPADAAETFAIQLDRAFDRRRVVAERKRKRRTQRRPDPAAHVSRDGIVAPSFCNAYSIDATMPISESISVPSRSNSASRNALMGRTR